LYNLLISSDVKAWDGEPYLLKLDRCVREYTDTSISKKFGDFTENQVDSIRRFPCIFAYEAFCQKDPKFGIILDVTKRQGIVKIEYEIIEMDNFITYTDMSNMLFGLNIGEFEIKRTHWAIKDVDLPKELSAKDIKLPYWAKSESNAVDITKHEFDVAFSFPGELKVRNYVESVAAKLEREIGPNSYFYDNNYKAQLARPSLDNLLQDIYRNRSKLAVVFLCEKYQEKDWCGIEFKAIQEIILERDFTKIMYIKMDDGQVEGVFKTDGFIDGRNYAPAEVARFINQRVQLLQ
jgi:hypothetical protein